MSPAADSAGQPFEGRSFSPNPFSGDSGEADATLVRAQDAFHALLHTDDTLSALPGLAVAWTEVVRAVRDARLLSPLIAEAGQWGVTEDGKQVDKSQELSVPHLQGPDGRAVAPVFSDVASMATWNKDARPIPVEGHRAALAAASDGLELMVLDPASPRSVVFRRSALRSIATGEDYLPPWLDPLVAEEVQRGVDAGGAQIVWHRIVPGDPAQVLAGPEVQVVLGVGLGLSANQLSELTTAVGNAWAASTVLTERCDGISARVIPA
jgi:hypothetical protein